MANEVVRVIHYSAEAVVKEEIYLDNKEEVLRVIGEMYDRLDEDEFLEIDNSEHEREKVA
jgi:hypothetical protein